jgi:peptidoglycan/LPS O-acetylase OafA/YrhL
MIHKKMGISSFELASFGYTWVALFYLSLLLLGVTQHGFVSRLFRFRPLTELGMLAYGLYLFHYLLIGLVYGLAGKESPQLTGLSTIGLTLLSGVLVFALTRVSWRYFEKPLINRGHRYQYHYERVCAPVLVPVTVKLCEFPLASGSVDTPVERQIENHAGNRQRTGANAG